MNQRDYLDYANEELDVLVAVETKTAVDHIEEIVGTNGLDGIFIGPMDLATSFGHFCNPGDREVQEAIRNGIRKINIATDVLIAVANSFEDMKQKPDFKYNTGMFVNSQACAREFIKGKMREFALMD